VGERFADVNVVNRVPHGGGGDMVSAGIRYGEQTQLHFIDCSLNAQRDTVTRSCLAIHHLMFPHDNAWPHVARICTHFLEAENVPVLPWPAYSDILPIEHVVMLWIDV
jgi:hypothetical protein